ncbi:putative phosphodiesterase [Luteibacter jiangsuensis]|uniref:Phosphodiesterase n=1 Tax=Luteibacter jiangsuensis TaxID=637577 RepID=A0ABT9SWQ7_9GAMM|nr:metallophosphoesterase family protein [Luteibacter jiangsuensis]MDQ0009435.1 putative phosphodiesterase [Luteibacter jiangsuensis]
MKVAMLILSDVHISHAADPILGKAKEIAQASYVCLANVDAVLMLIAGDVAFSGRAEEYDLATPFFSEIISSLRAERDLPIHVAVVPGNHDCDFSQNDSIRKMLIKGVLSGDKADDEVVKKCTGVQEAFFAFRDALEGVTNKRDISDRLWRTTEIVVGDESVFIDAINVAWLSTLKEKIGELTFPWEDFAPALAPSARGLRVAIQHHPSNWLHQATYRPYRAFLKKRSQIVITGHEHEPNVGLTIDTEAATTTFVECGPLQEHDGLGRASFLVLTVDTGAEQVSAWRFSFDGTRFVPAADAPWVQPRALRLTEGEAFVVRAAFERTLNDPGAPIMDAYSREIELAQFFVYPDMTDQAQRGKRGSMPIYSSTELASMEWLKTGVIVAGEEKSGRTSLLYQLFGRYRDAALIPVIVNGKDLKHTQPDQIERVIRGAFEAQYETDYLRFQQLEVARKVVLVDDFQFVGLKNEQHRRVLLANLKAVCGGLLIACDKAFSTGGLELDGVKLRRFSLQPFGYKARQELIQRWYGFSEPNLSEAEFTVRCDESERVVNHVMTRKVIPALPLYLVTLLQSLTVKRGPELIDSSLGHYYHYLISEAFRGSHAPLEKFNELFDYCAHLAWTFHLGGAEDLSEASMRRFTQEYAKEWTTTEFESRLEFLLKAKILERRGSSLSFRYPYVYYYLKGKYLAEQIDDKEVRAYIESACAQLYVRDNANTVLFLAHHAHEDFFVRSIQGTLDALFADFNPVCFDGDIRDVTDLVTKAAPKIEFRGGTPKEHRAKAAEFQDDMDDGDDGLMDVPETGDQASFQAQTTMLFKTTEVLGLLLKAQYSSFRHSRKQELLSSIFNGSMRGLRAIYVALIKEPERLQRRADSFAGKAVKNLEERRKLVERIIALIIEMLSFGYVVHAAECARSPDLRDDVEAVIKRTNSSAFDLISVAICLDSGNGLPRAELRELKKRVADNLVATRLLSLVVMYRLYMFETTDEDRVWVYREFGFGYGNPGAAIAATSSSMAGLATLDS